MRRYGPAPPSPAIARANGAPEVWAIPEWSGREDFCVVDFFDEVSEDMRADQARALLARYGGLFVLLCVAVVIAVAGWQWQQARNNKQDQRVAGLFLTAAGEAAAATSNPTRARAIADFQSVERQGHPDYTALARLDEASLRYDSGDVKDALVLWDQVAGDGDIPVNVRDLALVLWVQHQLDDGDPAMLEARLQPILVSTNVWHALASEEMALLQLRQGQTAPARKRLEALVADPTASQSVRQRAEAVLASLGG